MVVQTNDPEFEAMIQAPQFMNLNSQQKAQAVQEFKQFKRSSVPKSENFLNTAMNAVGQGFKAGIPALQLPGIMNAVNSRPVQLATGGFENMMTLGASDAMRGMIPEPYREEFSPMPEHPVPMDIRGLMGIAGNPAKYNENLLRMGGEATGMMMGLAGAAYGAGEQALVRGGAGALEKFLMKSLGRSVGGAAGGALLPGSPEERISHAKTGAMAGPVVGGVGDVLSGPISKLIGTMTGKGVKAARGRQADVGASKMALAEEQAQLQNVQKGMKTRGGVEEARVGRKLASEAETGVQGKVTKEFTAAKDNFKKVVEEADTSASNFTEYDMLEVMDKTVRGAGLTNRSQATLTSDEAAVIKLYENLQESVSMGGGKSLGPDVINNMKRNIQKVMSKSPHLEGQFYKHLGPRLEETGMSALKGANKLYQTAYGKLDASKLLKMSKYKAAGKIGKGAPSKPELEAMRGAEETVGVDYLENLMKTQGGVRAKYGSGQRGLDKRFAQSEKEMGLIDDLASRYATDAKWAVRKQIGANALVGLPAAKGLIDKMFGGSGTSEFINYVTPG